MSSTFAFTAIMFKMASGANASRILYHEPGAAVQWPHVLLNGRDGEWGAGTPFADAGPGLKGRNATAVDEWWRTVCSGPRATKATQRL